MATFKKIKDMSRENDMLQQLTTGEVVDTNDPQQMGRVRVACPYFGDGEDTLIKDIPWATPISPLAGVTEVGARGREDAETVGPVSYGMFNTPKIGSFVLIACLEGDPKFRIYLGGLHEQFMPHTLPHGRYTYNTTTAFDDEPSGPLSSSEDPIQPLYDSQTESFTKSSSATSQEVPEPRKNFEYRTRGADHGVSGLGGFITNSDQSLYSSIDDDAEFEFTEADGNKIEHTYGYHKSRIRDDVKSGATGFVYEPQVYCWTTPGLHSISMADNSDSCRMRFRTTHGHQIIMDDTNERIYLSTANGKTWIELDEAGNIDIYGERNISLHAEKNINLTAGDSIRMKAANGIHMASDADINLQSASDLHVNAGGTLFLASGEATNILAGGNIIQTGAMIHLNGPAAAPAGDAFWTNRVPEHEPWGRIMSNDGNSWDLEYGYNDADVGKKEQGDDLKRNPKWHR